MGTEHNLLAQRASSLLLAQLRTEQASWARVAGFTSRTVYGTSLTDWPRPDAAFVDRAADVGMALEFKPPGQSKREYLTGLGQALSYLDRYHFAVLILPSRAGDGFEIAAYVRRLLEHQFAGSLPVALLVYESDPGDAGDLTPVVELRPRSGNTSGLSHAPTGEMFWAYWRDASQHDVFHILRFIDRSSQGTFEMGYRTFWRKLLARGAARTWEGETRKAYTSSYPQHRLNTRMSLLHIGLIMADGRLSPGGLELLQAGKVYGPESLVFCRELARRILEAGRHLELIFWVVQTQRKLDATEKLTSKIFNRALDSALQREGVIERVGTGVGKPSFLRDEQKLWNKLGLLERASATRYFHKGEGLRFNWRVITSIVGD